MQERKEWRASEARDIWYQLDAIERWLVCCGIVSPKVRALCRKRGSDPQRMLGCLQLCALEEGLQISITA